MQRLLSGLLLGLLATSCAAPAPEDALRELVAEAEAAAEARDTGFFRARVSERYTDRGGRDRAALIDLLRGYFLTHARVEVAARIEEIAVLGDDAAAVTLYFGLAAHAGESLLGGWDGELRRIELEFVRESGDWRLIGARW